jgi:hypothetical protein
MATCRVGAKRWQLDVARFRFPPAPAAVPKPGTTQTGTGPGQIATAVDTTPLCRHPPGRPS